MRDAFDVTGLNGQLPPKRGAGGGGGGDVTAPVISGGGVTGSTVDFTSTEGGTTYYLIDDNATRSAAQVEAGGGLASGSFAVSAGATSQAIDVSGVTSGGHYLHIMTKDAAGNRSNVIDMAIIVDNAPVLSAPTDIKTGATSMSGTVSTTDSDGTLYWVISTSATTPSAAQVEAGQMHTGAAAAESGSQAVTVSGAQAITDMGLTASTAYYTHYMHKDAAGQRSNVASADGFTTDAASGPVFVQSAAYSDQSYNTACDLVMPSGIVSGSKLVVILTIASIRTITAPGGWSLLGSIDHESGASGTTYVYTKTAAGTEGGTTITWTSSAAVKSAFGVYELTLPVGTVEMASVATFDPPSLSPSGGSREYVWIAQTSHYSTGSYLFTAAPSGYSGYLTARTDPATNGSDGDRTTAYGHKISTASSEDPGLFSYNVTPPANRREAITIAAW